MDNSAIICDDVIKSYTENIEAKSNNKKTNFNEKNITCKIQNFYNLLAFDKISSKTKIFIRRGFISINVL